MKKTYTETWTMSNEKLQKATVKVIVYDKPKYEVVAYGKEDEGTKLEYTGLVSWTIISGGEEAKMVEELGNVVDDYHEYLILNFNNGSTATFRNSYVDFFLR